MSDETTRARLDANALALLNCRSVGESFTSEDRDSLTKLIQLAGDRLQQIDALQKSLAAHAETVARLERERDGYKKDSTDVRAELQQLEQRLASIREYLRLLRLAPDGDVTP